MNAVKLVEGQDYVVRQVPFPNCSADGAVVSHPDLACIYINSNVCPTRQKEALEHELEHIENGDLYSDDSASEIEERMND